MGRGGAAAASSKATNSASIAEFESRASNGRKQKHQISGNLAVALLGDRAIAGSNSKEQSGACANSDAIAGAAPSALTQLIEERRAFEESGASGSPDPVKAPTLAAVLATQASQKGGAAKLGSSSDSRSGTPAARNESTRSMLQSIGLDDASIDSDSESLRQDSLLGASRGLLDSRSGRESARRAQHGRTSSLF